MNGLPGYGWRIGCNGPRIRPTSCIASHPQKDENPFSVIIVAYAVLLNLMRDQ
ncbi:MAG: hypothetical protein WBM35_00640 [Candidatus Electrothrix sp.]